MKNMRRRAAAIAAISPPRLPPILRFPTDDGPRPDEGPSVAELVKAYLADAYPQLKPATYEASQRVVKMFSAHFGHRAAMSIRGSDVRSWIHARETWRTSGTRWTAGVTIRRLFNWAVTDGRLPRSPIGSLGLTGADSRTATTENEYQLAMRHAGLEYRRFLIFIRSTGARPGEGRLLQWEWINWTLSVAVYPKDHHKTGHHTGKSKALALTTPARKLLAFLYRRRQAETGAEPTGTVFLNSYGKPWRTGAISAANRALSRKSGVPMGALVYRLRHAFGTAGVARGAPIKLVSHAMGHAKVSMTEANYVHLEGHIDGMMEAAEMASRRQLPKPQAHPVPAAPPRPPLNTADPTTTPQEQAQASAQAIEPKADAHRSSPAPRRFVPGA